MEDLIQLWNDDKNKGKAVAKQILNNLTTDNEKEFDQKIKLVSTEVVNKIDCLSCGNCCRTTVTTFNDEDINRASKFLKISRKQFINEFLITDNGEYTTITTPCPFLELDNKCAIYEARPQACASFPHLTKKKFFSRKQAHVENYIICPIVYSVFNRLK
jgi:uncharacterized protein